MEMQGIEMSSDAHKETHTLSFLPPSENKDFFVSIW